VGRANAQRDGRPAEYSWGPLFNDGNAGRKKNRQKFAIWAPSHNLSGKLKFIFAN